MSFFKPKLLQTPVPLLSLVALFLMLANKAHSYDTTSFNFDCFASHPGNLIYQGEAHVPSGSPILRLTKTDGSGKPVPWSVGRVLFSRPVRFWERLSPPSQVTFDTTISFVITPAKNGAADGIAFFIAPVNTTIPTDSAGPNLGIFDSKGTSSSLFAVEFDTYGNPSDPNSRHIGININSIKSRATAKFDSAVGQLVTARISYHPNTGLISVVASSGSQSAALSYVFDLKTVLPQDVRVGISSSTGRFVSQLGIADIHSWYFTSTLVPTRVNDESEKEEPYIRQYVPV